MDKVKKEKIGKIILTIVILLQVCFNIYIGSKKEYFHMDEAYSYGLMNYDKINITDNEDFLNKWHSKDYYIDYWSVNKDEIGDIKRVYINQKNDVHPPLYYLFLRIASLTTIDSFSKWTGIGLNIILGVIITILIYKTTKKLFGSQVMAILTATVNTFSMAMTENILYIRMYALFTMNLLLYVNVLFNCYSKKELKVKDMLLLGGTFILGGMTQYYFFIFVIASYGVLIYKSIKEKEYSFLKKYTITAIISAIVYLIIFPFAISHIFFGYRGPGAATQGLSVVNILMGVLIYINIVDKNIFNYLVIPFTIIILIIANSKRKVNNNSETKKEKLISFLWIPTLFYFIVVSIITPYKELRYILPICPMIIICTIYLANYILRKRYSQKAIVIILGILFLLITITTGITNNKLDFTYEKHNNIAKRIDDLNAPIIYIFNTNNNRFLDDIYLFTLVEDSYVLKAEDLSEEKVQEILDGKEFPNGIIIMCNEGTDKEKIEQCFSNVSENEMEYIQRMNACDIYYLK